MVHPPDTLPAAVRAYRNAWTRVDAVVAAASLDRSCRDVRRRVPGQPSVGVDAPTGGDGSACRTRRHPPRAHRWIHRSLARISAQGVGASPVSAVTPLICGDDAGGFGGRVGVLWRVGWRNPISEFVRGQGPCPPESGRWALTCTFIAQPV